MWTLCPLSKKQGFICALALALSFALLLPASLASKVEAFRGQSTAQWLCVDSSEPSGFAPCAVPLSCGRAFQGAVTCVANGEAVSDGVCLDLNLVAPEATLTTSGCNPEFTVSPSFSASAQSLDLVVQPVDEHQFPAPLDFLLQLTFSEPVFNLTDISCGLDVTCVANESENTIEITAPIGASGTTLSVTDLYSVSWHVSLMLQVKASLVSTPSASVLVGEDITSLGHIGVATLPTAITAAHFSKGSSSFLGIVVADTTAWSGKAAESIIIVAPASLRISSCSLSWRTTDDSSQWLLAGAAEEPISAVNEDGYVVLNSADSPFNANGVRILCTVTSGTPTSTATLGVFFVNDESEAFTPAHPIPITSGKKAYVAVTVADADLITAINNEVLTNVTGVTDAVAAIYGNDLVLTFRLNDDTSPFFPLFTIPASFSSLIDAAEAAGITQLHGATFTSSTAGDLGQWKCGAPGRFSTCSIRNNCGYETVTEKHCVVDETSVSAAACTWAAEVPAATAGCGSFMCVLPDGTFTECDNQLVCEAGCSSTLVNVVNPDPTSGPFKQVCVKDGASADSSTFCPSPLVAPATYASQCTPISECRHLCHQVGTLARVDCDDPDIYSECSTLCGVGTKVANHSCGHADTAIGDVIEPVDMSLCEYASAAQPTVVECHESSGCAGMYYMCNPDPDTVAYPINYTHCGLEESWGSCKLNCVNERSVKCVMLGPNIPPIMFPDYACAGQIKPPAVRECSTGLCHAPSWRCYASGASLAESRECDTTYGFGECPKKGCNIATLSRNVVCTRGNTTAVPESHCPESPFLSTMGCGPWTGEDSECVVSLSGSQCFLDANENTVAGVDGTCVPHDMKDKQLFRKGNCVDKRGMAANEAWCNEPLLQPCSLSTCTTEPQWKCFAANDPSSSPVSCENEGAFPKCPIIGCAEPEVTRGVACFVGSEQVDQSICRRHSPPPPTKRVCPAVTSLCSVDFKGGKCMYDVNGNIDSDARSHGCTNGSHDLFAHGLCRDENGKEVNPNWCTQDDIAMRCIMPPCRPDLKMSWSAAEGACVQPESRCLTYRVNTVSCMARSNSFAQPMFVTDLLCDEADKPDPVSACTDRLITCAPHSTCSSTPAPEGGKDYAHIVYGTCICSRGFTGKDCSTKIEVSGTSAVIVGDNLVIGWNLTEENIELLTGTAVVALSEPGSTIPFTFATAEISQVRSVSIPLLDVYDNFSPGVVDTWVIMGGLHHTSSFTLPPLCTVTALACQNGGVCDGETGKCACETGYSGPTCNVSPCDELGCHKDHGVCVFSEGVASCVCNTNEATGLPLYSGTTCDTPVGCERNDFCQNGGVIGGFVENDTVTCTGCSCRGHWEGERCAACGLFDDCFFGAQDATCTKCECAVGYDGEYCGCRYVTATMLFEFPNLLWYVPNSLLVKSWASSLQFAIESSLGNSNLTASLASHGRYRTRAGHVTDLIQATVRLRALCMQPANHFDTLGTSPENHNAAVAKLHEAVERFKAAFASKALFSEHRAFVGIRHDAGLGLVDANCAGAHCPRSLGAGGVPPDNTAPPSPSASGSVLSDGELVAIIVISVIGGIAAITLVALAFRYGWLCFGSGSTPKMPSSSAGTEPAVAEMAAV